MAVVKQTAQERIDALMQEASLALVERRYFHCERLCVDALQQAHAAADYERMSRIVLPLQEARRQKRDMAVDAAERGHVFILDAIPPLPGDIKPGMYFVQPPRVGLDGKLLREAADRGEIPILVIVREPTTLLGQCPIVALGPLTARVRIDGPEYQSAAAAKKTKAKAGAPAAKKPPRAAAPAPISHAIDPASSLSTMSSGNGQTPIPTVRWMLHASEALGDASIAAVDTARGPISRADELYLRLQGHTDHEKLHQALMKACEEVVKLGPGAVKRKPIDEEDEMEDE
ncbi:hypothetical protein BH11PLA1_BH11PLA1_02680 [soil metagenome]